MWPMTGAARDQLAQSHTAACRVDVIRAGKKAFSLDVLDGSVNTDAGRSTMANFSATIIDPTGVLAGSDTDDVLNPYQAQLAPYRGVWVPSAGGYEYAPLGVFQMTARSVSGDGSVQVTGQDRAIIYQGPMTGSLGIPASTPIENAIRGLLFTRNRGLQMRTWKTGFNVGPLLYSPDIDVWKEAQLLAQSVGGYLYHDRQGVLTFAPPLPSSPRPARRYSEGDGLLLDAVRSEDSDTIHNVVVVQKASGSTVRAVAADTNTQSPTYAGGKYGRRVVTITNAHVNTIQQAQQAARNQLVLELGRSETVTLSVVPDPTVDVMEAITVNRPSADLDNRGLAVQSTTIPLTVTAAMTIACRKYTLTENGQQIDSPILATTS